jgi:hypothetical protein
MKRAIILATAALLAMLILVPMALAQDTTFFGGTTAVGGGGGTMVSIPQSATMGFTGFAPSAGGPTPNAPTGGPAILLPAASLLLGSGILTYAILRRR